MSHVLKDVEGFERRADMFFIDPTKVKVVDGWNDRTDFSGEEELIASISEIGVKQPIKVKKNQDKELELVDGERRLRATLKAIEQGASIKSIPAIVIPSKTSEIDLYLDSIVSNTGKQLTPVEEANSFKRLISWGLPVKEIAIKTGRSVTHVRNRLELSDAIPAVKEAVQNGELSVQDATEIVNESEGKVEPQQAALEKKKSEPKKPRRKTVLMKIKGGEFKSKSGNTELCEQFTDFLGFDFRKKIINAGFDPDSIKISISKNKVEEPEKNQMTIDD